MFRDHVISRTSCLRFHRFYYGWRGKHWRAKVHWLLYVNAR